MNEQKEALCSLLSIGRHKLDNPRRNGDLVVSFLDELSKKIISNDLHPDVLFDALNLTTKQLDDVLYVFKTRGGIKRFSDIFENSWSANAYEDYREASNWLDHSLESLRFHIKNEFKGVEGHNSLEFRIYESNHRLSIGLKRQVPVIEDPVYLWDEIFLKSSASLMIFLKLSIERNLGVSVRRGDRKSKQFPVMGKYHPERFMAYRGYVSSATANSISKTPFGAMTNKQAAALKDEIRQEVSDAISNVIWSGHVNKNIGLKHLIARKETEVFSRRASFHIAGKRIFDIHPLLSEMFMHTDMPDVSFGQINTPFVSFFLHFGAIESLSVSGGWFLDGAYIDHLDSQKVFQIMFTFCNNDSNEYFKWPLQVEHSYPISIKSENYEKNISDGVKSVVAAQREINEQNLTLIRDEDKVYVPGGYVAMIDITRFSARIESKILPEYFNIAEKATTLVLNAIFCITQYPEKIITSWPDNAPADLINKIEEGTPKEVKASKSKLEMLGYKSISFLGPKSFPGLAVPSGHYASKASHWRKGHWREQAYGKGWAQHRRKWIWPVLINKDKGDPILGGIYDIQDPDMDS